MQGNLIREKGGIVGGSRLFAGKGAWIRRLEGLEGMGAEGFGLRQPAAAFGHAALLRPDGIGI